MMLPLAPFKANDNKRKSYLQCRIEALTEAKDIALSTGDGKTAAQAIQVRITTLQLKQEMKEKKCLTCRKTLA